MLNHQQGCCATSAASGWEQTQIIRTTHTDVKEWLCQIDDKISLWRPHIWLQEHIWIIDVVKNRKAKKNTWRWFKASQTALYLWDHLPVQTRSSRVITASSNLLICLTIMDKTSEMNLPPGAGTHHLLNQGHTGETLASQNWIWQLERREASLKTVTVSSAHNTVLVASVPSAANTGTGFTAFPAVERENLNTHDNWSEQAGGREVHEKFPAEEQKPWMTQWSSSRSSESRDQYNSCSFTGRIKRWLHQLDLHQSSSVWWDLKPYKSSRRGVVQAVVASSPQESDTGLWWHNSSSTVTFSSLGGNDSRALVWIKAQRLTAFHNAVYVREGSADGGRAAAFRGWKWSAPHCSSTQHLLLKQGRPSTRVHHPLPGSLLKYNLKVI